jgi:hypothetical protein
MGIASGIVTFLIPKKKMSLWELHKTYCLAN